jgi:hypothetical protein
MKKPSQLQLTILLIIVTCTFAIGSDKYWLGTLSVGLTIYYFMFLINQFKRMYSTENLLTKIFLDYPKTPIYIAGATALTIGILEKSSTPIDFKSAYVSVVVGILVSIISLIKKKMFQNSSH